MIIPWHTAAPTPQPNPATDPAGTPVLERIAEILLLLQTLAAYGRHLAAAIPQRGLWRGFATIAKFFGTAAIPEIAVRVQRGILRALALQAVLLRRAGRGRDLGVLAPRLPDTRTGRQRAPKPASETAPLTFESLPSQQQLEMWARRCPIGRTITDICLDLGISPSLCTGPFWNRLFEAIQDYNGSLGKLLQEVRRREQKFEKEDWKRPHLEWPARTREAIREALGFFVGEPPPEPATGPP